MDLSILIPARSEMFLSKTIENILENIGGQTEVIAVCDGDWPEPRVKDDPRVILIHHSVSIGQRAATNEAARLSRAKYIMKCDAHCSFDKDFDVKLMADCEYDWTVVPRMYNLHAFNWKCKDCGNETYQGPTLQICQKCGHRGEFEKVILWKEKTNPTSDFMRFDKELHFQYWREYKDRPEAQGDICDTMSLIGACWFMHRDRYWDLDGVDEAHGSWGQMGTEIACKAWLSGGRLVVNKKTWFAHLFRTQGGDFGFPYPNPGIKKARNHSRKLWLEGTWPKAKYPLQWLIDKFAPVPGWDDEPKVSTVVPKTVTKGLLYYTDNNLDTRIMDVVQKNLNYNCNGNRLVSVSLKPISFGENITLPLTRGHLAMAKQQLAGLEKLDTDIVFMVEHDVLYPACHFDFVPPRRDKFYYNMNWWKVRASDGQALHFKAKQVSGLCAYRDILIEYYRNRVRMMESGEIGGRRHFEPGTRLHDEYKKLTTHGFDTWSSEIPYVDIRHNETVSRNVFDPSGYRTKVQDWVMADEIPNWGKSKGRFNEWLNEVEANAVQKA